MRRKRVALGVFLLLFFVLLPVPAVISPYVSDDPIHWAYRAYHPFMYRYPAVLGVHSALELETKPRQAQSIEVLRLMIKHW